jgi:hypothetical protein
LGIGFGRAEVLAFDGTAQIGVAARFDFSCAGRGAVFRDQSAIARAFGLCWA